MTEYLHNDDIQFQLQFVFCPFVLLLKKYNKKLITTDEIIKLS